MAKQVSREDIKSIHLCVYVFYTRKYFFIKNIFVFVFISNPTIGLIYSIIIVTSNNDNYRLRNLKTKAFKQSIYLNMPCNNHEQIYSIRKHASNPVGRQCNREIANISRANIVIKVIHKNIKQLNACIIKFIEGVRVIWIVNYRV